MPSGFVDLRSGPYSWYRPRWSGGPRWRRVWVRFFVSRRGVTLQAHTKAGGFPVAGCYLHNDYWGCMSYAQQEDYAMGFIKRVSRPDQSSLARPIATDPEWVCELPALHEYLSSACDESGSVRRTSTLTLFAEQGSWKVFLNERQLNASLCASGDTVGAALAALEVLLEAENTPWRWNEVRPARPQGKQRRET